MATSNLNQFSSSSSSSNYSDIDVPSDMSNSDAYSDLDYIPPPTPSTIPDDPDAELFDDDNLSKGGPFIQLQNEAALPFHHPQYTVKLRHVLGWGLLLWICSLIIATMAVDHYRQPPLKIVPGCPPDASQQILPLVATLAYPQSLYAILSVYPNATAADIRRASLKARRNWHPDHSLRYINSLFVDCGISPAAGYKPFTEPAANAAFYAVQAAITILSSTQLREKYDMGHLDVRNYGLTRYTEGIAQPLDAYGLLKTDWWECANLRQQQQQQKQEEEEKPVTEAPRRACNRGRASKDNADDDEEDDDYDDFADQIIDYKSKDGTNIWATSPGRSPQHYPKNANDQAFPRPGLEPTRLSATWRQVKETLKLDEAASWAWMVVWRPQYSWLDDPNWIRRKAKMEVFGWRVDRENARRAAGEGGR